MMCKASNKCCGHPFIVKDIYPLRKFQRNSCRQMARQTRPRIRLHLTLPKGQGTHHRLPIRTVAFPLCRPRTSSGAEKSGHDTRSGIANFTRKIIGRKIPLVSSASLNSYFSCTIQPLPDFCQALFNRRAVQFSFVRRLFQRLQFQIAARQ